MATDLDRDSVSPPLELLFDTPTIETDNLQFPCTVLERRKENKEYTSVTCEKSAELRDIELCEELKSIVFSMVKNSDWFVICHIPGDKMVNTTALKNEFGKIRMLSLEELRSSDLEKGRVNPFTVSTYLGPRIIHAICPSVFKNNLVHSNNDRVGGWIQFRPQEVIHFVPNVVVLPVSKPKPIRDQSLKLPGCDSKSKKVVRLRIGALETNVPELVGPVCVSSG